MMFPDVAAHHSGHLIEKGKEVLSGNGEYSNRTESSPSKLSQGTGLQREGVTGRSQDMRDIKDRI